MTVADTARVVEKPLEPGKPLRDQLPERQA